MKQRRYKFMSLSKFCNTVLTVFMILSCCTFGHGELIAYAQSHNPGEYDVKAAFIYNFIKFIEWPNQSSKGAEGDITLCIIGENPFDDSLDFINGKPVKGKMLKVEHIKNCADTSCKILFISGSEKGRLAEITDAIKGLHILTVGDTDDFARQGVIINFYLQENKVRFEINLEAARQAGLEISSKLLSLSTIVRSSRAGN